MSSHEIDGFYDHVKRFHDSENFKSVIPDLDSSNLIPKLREYQIDAVKWMLFKEYQLDSDNLPQEYNGMNIKFPKGGILADEMGLGKTVEMISLILNNPCNDPLVCLNSGEPDFFLDFEESDNSSQPIDECSTVEEADLSSKTSPIENDNSNSSNQTNKRLRKRKNISYAGLDEEIDYEPMKKKSKSGQTYNLLKLMYDQALSEVNHRSSYREQRSNSLKCSCSGYVNSEIIECIRCHSTQHKTCVGLDNFTVAQYYCPKCLSKMQPKKSRATFIVSPESIVFQWMDEIKRHVKNDKLKVYYYTGVKGNKYIQPAELADNDVVITTYSVLSSDLNYCVEESTRSLRYKKKFFTFPPPIKSIDWWRICLDEAQMVEGPNTKPGIMARELMTTHRWAVTGTPIQKSVNDLYGLMQFFMMEPFMDNNVWSFFIEDQISFYDILKHLMWRSRKVHVYTMLGIPEQTIVCHWLQFSPVEGHFYERTHADCTAQFNNKLNRVDDPSVTLCSLNRAFISKIMAPLLSLRQACTHPQAVRGKFLKYKHTMTMDELLSDMVGQARLDVDVCVRTVVASFNGQAGLKVLLGEIKESIHLYRQVLQLQYQYSPGVIKVDKLQRLHTLHNLADVIKEFGVSDSTLRDSTLAQDAEDLARNYIEKYDHLINASEIKSKRLKKQVEVLSQGRPLGYTDWWERVITTCDDPRELVSRVRVNVLDQQTKFPLKCSYSNKIRNIETLYGELALWLAETDDSRREVINKLAGLCKSDPVVMSQQAIYCHLRNGQERSKKSKCKLCSFETVLLAYESRIFAITKEDQEGRKKNKYARSDDDEINAEDLDEDKRKEIQELEVTIVLKTKKEGNWKPSQMERILQVISSWAKSRRYELSVTQDGQKHLAILEGVRKEFLSLRTLWRHISDRVAAYDELFMAKMRFRLPFPDELKAIQKKKLKEPYIIQEHEIGDQLDRLFNERVVAERDIARNIGILMYLQNLQKNPNTERDPCPVCQEPLSNKWSVLQCGHCFCFECIPNMFGNNNTALHIDCAVCRRKTHRSSIAYVDCTIRAPLDDEIRVKGSHSTKVEAIVIEVSRIYGDDPTAKILIFSAWEKVLDVIGEAFELNDISFRRLTSSKNRSKQAIADFKNSDVTALLMPLKLGSKGLNLIEATHVFLVEPILNPGEELQAVGRVHRIGQTKKTYIHRFVIRNTIEQKMLSALNTSNTEEWSADRVTLKQLFELFNRSDKEFPDQPNQPSHQASISIS